MLIDKSLLEEIVYSKVANNDWIEKLLPFTSKKINEYKLDVSIGRFKDLTTDIKIYFTVKLYNYKDRSQILKHDNTTIGKDIYLEFMREQKLKDMAVTPEDKIRQSLSEYLEFNSDELFKNKFNLVRVFGGAIRDIISEQKIHDVDIICGSKAIKYIEMILEQNGYQYMEMLNGKDLQEMYSEIHIINEPHTWIKGKKIVQLIRPVVFDNNDIGYEKGFRDLISNVDFSCCGVSYDGEKLYEDYPNAIVHCQSKVFSVNMRAKMYSQKRAQHRKVKLETRGWKEIEIGVDIDRGLKLDLII